MKKAILSAALALVMLLSIFPATAFAEGATEKFYFGVTSGNTTVDATVDSDYNVVVKLPADATVNTNSVTVTARMTDVASLGVTGTRTHTLTLNTGAALGENEVNLATWLRNAYNFNGGTINATIDGKACTYTFGEYANGQIAATTDTEAARAAWHALTSYITAGTQATGDSYILIAKDSYAKIGTEYLRFEDNADDLKLDNFSDMSTMNTTIRDHVKLETCTDQGNTITLYVGKGTTLAVGSSVATLNKGCTVTIMPTGESADLGDLKTALSSLRDAASATDMVKTMVTAFNNVIGVVDAAESVNVNFVFDKDPTPPTPSRPSSGGSYSVVTKDMPLVRSGSRGEDVKTLQAQLNALGYDCGTVDGIFGAKTYNAVVKFQKDRGLAVDGIVGKNTWAALGVTGTTVVETQTASITSNMPLLCRGSIGEAVKTLQTRLNALGYDCGTVDGIFGIKTYNAVVKFQTARALAVDGIVGVNTWGALA